jgi:hypothetical protein
MQFNILHLYRLRDRAQMERGVIRVYITKPYLYIVSESARRWGEQVLVYAFQYLTFVSSQRPRADREGGDSCIHYKALPPHRLRECAQMGPISA